MDKDKIRRERECILKVLEKKIIIVKKKIDIEKGECELKKKSQKRGDRPCLMHSLYRGGLGSLIRNLLHIEYS